LLADGRDLYLRRSGATLFSILVHVLLLWLFISRLAGNAGDGDAIGAGNGRLNSFSLSDPASAAPSSSSEARQAPQPRPAAQTASDIDATAATELPPEWTVSRLPAEARPRSQASSESAAADAPVGPGGAGAGAGQGGSDVYDPYAGAAPLRRERDAAAAPSIGERVLGFFGFGPASAGGLTLDETALEAIRRAASRSLPAGGGTVELEVRVSPTGMVLMAQMRGGSAPREAGEALAKALIGKRLYRGSAADAQTLFLPPLSLG
jgi:hypothetical protein